MHLAGVVNESEDRLIVFSQSAKGRSHHPDSRPSCMHLPAGILRPTLVPEFNEWTITFVTTG